MTKHDDSSSSRSSDSMHSSSGSYNTGEIELAPGSMVGEYEIVERIGVGGFGSVFRAEHPLIGKTVAIKILHPGYSSQPQMISRFVSEARAVNQIQHPNIIDIFNFGTTEDELHYYVMELLTGDSLEHFLARVGKLDVPTTLRFVRPIGRALHAAHETGIAHRDLKAENIFLAKARDGSVEPKLLDFGIAKLLNDDERTHRTREGTPIGTPGYMSPEQCMGDIDVDHRTDVYAFGILVYRMLTGEMPFDGPTAMRVIMAHINTPPPSLHSLDPSLPKSIEYAVLAMLAKKPEQRPQTMLAALQSLEGAARAAGLDIPMDGSSITMPNPLALGDARHRWSQGKTHAAAATAGSGLGAEATMAPNGATAVGRGRTVASNVTNSDAVSGRDSAAPGVATARPSTDFASDAGSGKSRRMIIVAVVICVGVAVGVGLGLGGDGDIAVGASATSGTDTSAEPATAVEAEMPPADDGPPAGETPSAAEVAADVPPTPTVPTVVTVEIAGPPAGTEVYGPSGLLGVAPGSIQLPYTDNDVLLTFKADGFETMTHTLTASADTAIEVAMEPKPRKRIRREQRSRRSPDKGKPKNRRDALDSPF